ncbi:hypothetical protein GIB67_028804 [Kingdonia uniflora]|uniref:RNase H type-1 domain-containing protein n=1 Tax=Kingdonia uniflora TaxID=39325 RepID=A0A7J7LTA3_9MAGN|nr:hypothetical protein GIB67_028804 [Kingdonia uniflora]
MVTSRRPVTLIQLDLLVKPEQLKELQENLNTEKEKRNEFRRQLTLDRVLCEKELDAERQARLTALKRHEDQITGQDVADFLVDFSMEDPVWEEHDPDLAEDVTENPLPKAFDERTEWITRKGIEKLIRLDFEALNKVTEYEAFIHELDLTLELGVPELSVYTDSLLIVYHYSEQYKKNGKIIEYATLVADRMSKFALATFDYLPRGENRHTDSLAYLTKESSTIVSLVSALAKEGISVFHFDFAGNGESEGSFQFGNYSKEAEDLHAVVLYFSVAKHVISTILGHSKDCYHFICASILLRVALLLKMFLSEGNVVLLYASSLSCVPLAESSIMSLEFWF